VLCQYLLIGSAREAYIKKQGELYFGITLLMQPSDREAPSAASSEQDAATLYVGRSAKTRLRKTAARRIVLRQADSIGRNQQFNVFNF